MPGPFGSRALVAALLSSALLVSACGSIPFLAPTPTPAPTGRAFGGGGSGGGAGARGARAGGGAGQGQAQGQSQSDGPGQGPGQRQGQGQGGPRGSFRGGGAQAAGTPNAQSPIVNGEVDVVDGRTVTVATNTGWRKVDVPDSATILTEGKGTGADLTAGALVAVTSKPDGTALIVRLFPPGSNPRVGQFPMNGPNAGNTMTNATIESFDGKQLSLNYNGDKASITVPPDAQIVKPVPAAFTDITVGSRVQAAGTVNGDTLAARSVTILPAQSGG
jgi:hypothetical protein